MVPSPKSGPVLVEGTDIIGDFVRMIFFQDFAVVGFDLDDWIEGDGDTGIGESTKGDGHIGHQNFTPTQG